MHYYFCATYGYVDKGFRNSRKILGITRTLSQVMKVQLFVKQNMFFTLVWGFFIYESLLNSPGNMHGQLSIPLIDFNRFCRSAC